MLPVGENSKGFGSSLRCPQSEENVLHWFKDVLSATILAEGEQEEGRSFGKLLKAVGRGEEELCQRGEVTTFDELKLGFGYGEFLAKNAEEIGSLLDRFDDTDASSPLTRDLRTFCDELKALQCNASEALCGIRGHFASLLSPAQAQVAWNRASGLTNAAASPVLVAWARAAVSAHTEQQPGMAKGDKIQKTADAVEEIASAPFLMDLQVVLDWEDQFQPVLGELSSFLSSSDFATQWNRRGRRRDADDPGQITLLGWRHFVRLPSGSVEDFAKALDRKDPAAASGAVLHRYLAEGRNFRQDQFVFAAEEALRGWRQDCHQREIFVLQAITALPLQWRDAVAPIFAKAYTKLGLPKREMLHASRRRADWTTTVRWLAKNTGVTEWELKWESFYGVDLLSEPEQRVPPLPRRDHGHHGRHGAAAAPSRGAAQLEMSDVDSSDGVISEGTDEDEGPRRDDGSENVKLCRRIARNKGVKFQDVDPSSREWLQRPLHSALRSLQQTVQGAVKRLADDLYSGEVHFMLELLQNADDCDFPSDALPSLTVTFESNPEQFAKWTTFEPSKPASAYLIIEHNETGFRDFNLKALCDIAQSTKAGGARKFIGAKGIGFKSVFCATTTPVVHSGLYHCHFDSEALEGLGYLIPFPLTRPSGFKTGTRLVLPLYEQSMVEKCRRVVEDLKPELLLFLRKLEKITIVDHVLNVKKTIQKFIDEEGREVRLDTSTVSTAPDNLKEDASKVSWYVHRRPVALPRAMDGQRDTDLQIAFPRSTESFEKEQQLAFAWLPLRSYGFRFIVQADWAVPSSRESILAEHPLNQSLRAALPETFCELIEQLAERALAIDDAAAREKEFQRLYSLIPLEGQAAEFFVDTPKQILSGLEAKKFVLVRQGGKDLCVTPKEVVRKELSGQAETLHVPSAGPGLGPESRHGGAFGAHRGCQGGSRKPSQHEQHVLREGNPQQCGGRCLEDPQAE
ncbi:unnamed protein product [Durusdinium trenchii]|uniref:Sacsin/Nov domain-containing protein n=1 Tax=Durusdinium trenchii TaxID=1381693 RepID=A0ABP0ISD2_9DINO